MYKEWLIPSDFTPSGPDDLTVYVDVRSNMNGDLEPVIVAEWKAKDDGGLLMHFQYEPDMLHYVKIRLLGQFLGKITFNGHF